LVSHFVRQATIEHHAPCHTASSRLAIGIELASADFSLEVPCPFWNTRRERENCVQENGLKFALVVHVE
jgi:hypothetical protein